MERTSQRKCGGFSFVEFVVALLILSLGLVGLAMVQLTAITGRNPVASSRTRVATGVAQAVLDRFQEAPLTALRSSHPDGFQQGPGGLSPAFSRLPAAAGDRVTVHGTTYYSVWLVTQDPEIPALKTISVWCCWRQGEGPWSQVVLVTQRADVGY